MIVKGFITKWFTGLGCAAVLAAALAFGYTSSRAVTIESEPAPRDVRDVRHDATVEAVQKVLPSVVNVATTKIVNIADFYDPLFQRFYGRQQEQINSIGSGVIIDEDGYILTNLHVLRRATRIQVKLSNGEVYDAEARVGTSQKDVALIQIVLPPGVKKKFQAMKFAKDDDLLLGESVIAVGNPFGLGGSVTRGILSSKNRRATAGNDPLGFQDWLQTDADINPGNSGGPLVNLRGELIGINVAVGQGQGIGFAIPIKQVTATLAEFFSPEAANALWFGARVASFDAPMTISFVQRGSPAEQAGLRVGQRITSVNGVVPNDLVKFHSLVTARKDSDKTAVIQIDDLGKPRSITVQLMPFDDLIRQRLGLVLRNLTPETAQSIDAPNEGLIIDQVEKGSPAERAKLQPGFVLTGMEDDKMVYVINAADVLSTKKAGDRIKLSFTVPGKFGANAGRYTANLVTR